MNRAATASFSARYERSSREDRFFRFLMSLLAIERVEAG